VSLEVYKGPFPNGVSECCGAEPYKVTLMGVPGPWRCCTCSRPCTLRRPQRQDSIGAQLHDVIVMAERAGCYDAADWIRARV